MHSAMAGGLNVVFHVNEEQRTRSQMDFFVAPLPDRSIPADTATKSSAQLSGRYTFANFVIGKSNELAAAAAQAVAAAVEIAVRTGVQLDAVLHRLLAKVGPFGHLDGLR